MGRHGQNRKNTDWQIGLVPAFYGNEIFPSAEFPLRVECAEQLSRVPFHTHGYLEIAVVARGSAIHLTGGGEDGEAGFSYGILQGDIFSVLPGERHAYQASGDMVLYNIFLRPELLKDEWPVLSRLPSWRILFEADTGIRREKIHLSAQARKDAACCLEKIMRELFWQREGFQLGARSALVEFLLLALREEPVAFQSGSPGFEGILKCICRMEQLPGEKHTLAELGKEAAMSVSSYTKKFREATGLSSSEYLIRLRLDEARQLLGGSGLSVTEIAYRCGFSSTSHLIRLFRARQGITPAQYRRVLAQTTPPPNPADFAAGRRNQ